MNEIHVVKKQGSKGVWNSVMANFQSSLLRPKRERAKTRWRRNEITMAKERCAIWRYRVFALSRLGRRSDG